MMTGGLEESFHRIQRLVLFHHQLKLKSYARRERQERQKSRVFKQETKRVKNHEPHMK